MERSVSSVSNDYFLVEPVQNRSIDAVDAGGNEPPLVVPLDTNDDIITEPVTVDSSKSASPSIANTECPLDPSNVVHEAVKPKFVIVGGKVQRAQDTSKQDLTAVDVPGSRLSETLRSFQDAIRSFRERQSLPQRKKSKKSVTHKKKVSVTRASDGWSTEDEEDDIPTALGFVENQPDLIGMVTDVSIFGLAEVSHLIE